MDSKSFVATLSKLRPSATFLTLKGYTAENGEVADYNIIFHISYRAALERSLIAMDTYIPETDLEATAKQELIESFTKSLNKMDDSSNEPVDDSVYNYFVDDKGAIIKGVKIHKESNTLYLYGFVVNKKVLVSGNYKKTNSRALTITKNKLRNLCPVSKFRQFKITPQQVNQSLLKIFLYYRLRNN